MIRATIGGTPVTPLAGTLNISTQLNGRDTCKFDVRDLTGTYRPALGAEVVVTDTAVARVAGTAATFSRSSTRSDPLTGAPIASGVPAFVTLAGTVGLWVEQATTNVAQYSQQLDNAWWVKSAATISADSSTAPDGTATADRLIADTTTGVHRLNLPSITAGQPGTYSVWARSAGRRGLLILFDGSNFGYFDLTDGSYRLAGGSSVVPRVEAFPGGWYRCSLSMPLASFSSPRISVADGTSATNLIETFTGDGTTGIDLWGVQAESLAYPTTYMPTTGASATRSAEIVSFAASQVLRPDQGAVLAQVYVNPWLAGNIGGTGVARIWYASGGTGSAGFGVHKFNNRFTATVRNTAGTQFNADFYTTLTVGWHWFLAVWDGATLVLWIDGAPVTSVAYTGTVVIPATGYIGSGGGSTGQLNSAIASFACWDAAPEPDDRAAISLGDFSSASYLHDFSGATLVSTVPGRVFGGELDATEYGDLVTDKAGAKRVGCQVVSFDAILDRREVAASYESPTQTLGDIATDLVTVQLAGENITTGGVATGPIVDRVKWAYQPCSTCLRDLSDLTGYAWWVDYNRDLHFQPRAGIPAPFDLATGDGRFRSFKVTTTRGDYRNRQIQRGGLGLSDPRTEAVLGDGTTRAFVLAFPVGAVPTSITVGGVPQTIGIKGVDTGKDWYWNLGENTISQDDSATPLGVGVAATIAYRGQYPILVSQQDDIEIAARAAVEGGTGLHEAIADAPGVDTEASAVALALGQLRRYGRIPRRVTYETDEPGLRAGQIQTIEVPEHGVSGQWLIESTRARDVNGQFVRTTVTAIDGESVGGWVSFFAALAGSGSRVEFRENEVIVLGRQRTEQVTVTDTPSYVAAAPVTVVAETTICGYCEPG